MKKQKKNDKPENLHVIIAQFITLAGLLVMIEYCVKKGIISELYLAAPTTIVNNLIDYFSGMKIYRSIQVTYLEFLGGFLFSIAAGILLGVLMATVSFLNRYLKPFMSAIMAIPKVSLVPLFTIWFGLGYTGKLVFVIISCFFPILFNTISGVQQVSENHLKVARVFEANKLQVVIKVLLPSAMPTIFAGIRVAAAAGLMGALFSEMMGSKEGLGNLMTMVSQLFNTGKLFALIIITTTLSIITISIIELIERKIFLKWKEN